MLPSLSKHFVKALLKPLIRGATQEEMVIAKFLAKETRAQWLLTSVEMMKRRPHIHRFMDQPQRSTP